MQSPDIFSFVFQVQLLVLLLGAVDGINCSLMGGVDRFDDFGDSLGAEGVVPTLQILSFQFLPFRPSVYRMSLPALIAEIVTKYVLFPSLAVAITACEDFEYNFKVAATNA